MISVILPVYNGADFLRRQLEALAKQTYSGPWELIVADNGSKDASRLIAASWKERIPSMRIVDASARRGGAAARNLGAKAAEGSSFVFCDHDDIVSPEWLQAFVKSLEAQHLVAGRCEFLPLRSKAKEIATSATKVGTVTKFPYDYLPYDLSANLAISREAFNTVGGFDERLPAAEDVDLCWRIQLAGYDLHLEPHALVAKRRRPRLLDVWHQHFSYGLIDPLLYKRFRTKGMPRNTL